MSKWPELNLTDGVQVFDCSTDYLDWQNQNCCQCKKMADESASVDEIECDIERELSVAAFRSGSIPLPIANRMGPIEKRCKEFEPEE